jgi:hypothetical protein
MISLGGEAVDARMKEIEEIWDQFQGLYVFAGVLLGLLLFPLLDLFINNLSEFLAGLVPEAVGCKFSKHFGEKAS